MGLAGLLAVVASTELTRAFPRGSLLVPVLGSALAATAIAAIAFRIHALWRAAAQVIGFVIFATAVLTRSPAGVVHGVVHGWADILTSGVPLAVTPSERVVASFLVWAAAGLGAELAARAASPVVAASPALVAAVGGRMLAAQAPGDRPLLMAGAFVLVAGLLLWVRSGSGPLLRGRRKVLPLAAALGVGVALVVPAAVAGAAIGGARSAFDPRQYLSTPQSVCAQADPLQSLDALPSEALVRVDAAAGPSAAGESGAGDLTVPLRFAVLDTYDGASWFPGGVFEPAGTSLPAPGSTVPTRRVRLAVTVEGLTGCLLPTPAGATQAHGGQFAYDPTDEVLQDVQGLRVGQRFALTAQVPVWSAAALEAATPDTGAATRADRGLPPGVPATLVRMAQTVTAGATSPFGEVADLQQFFLKGGGFADNPSGAGGDDLAQLQRFLSPAGRAGTPEQFATAFTLLARALGLPARVVVGVQLHPSASPVAVTGAKVQAWPEVAFTGIGWVPFDPTPPPGGSARHGAHSAPRRAPLTAPQPPSSPAAIAGQVAAGQSSAGHGAPPHPGASAVLIPSHPAGGFPVWAVVALALVGVLLAFEVAVVLTKRRRRAKRRRATPPSARILGAWDEAVDRLRERGLPPTGSLTATEVVDAAAGVTSAETAGCLLPLCGALNRALYHPGGGRPGAAEEAWDAVDAFEDHLAASVGWVPRVAAVLDPRPLWRVHARPAPVGGREGAGELA